MVQQQQVVKTGLDVASFGAVLASFGGWLHPVLEIMSLSLSVCWLSIQVGGWLVKKWKCKHKE